LITNRKSHVGFRLVRTLVTLNELEWHNSPYFALFCGICSNLRSFEIRFEFESNFRFGIRFVLMIRFKIFESSAPSIVLCKETIGGG